MRIIQITPGAGGDYRCDNCLRDSALVAELRRLGHDTLMVPLYLPMAADGPDVAGRTPIFFGGINVYLQQKSALFRRTPRWLDRALDSPRLLRWIARRAAMTHARDLAEPTLSMLRGEHGRQVKELERLVAWLAGQERPDVVCLSNALLVGLARRMKAALGVPLVCMLQDEDGFLDALPEPQRAEAWRTLAQRAGEVDALVAVSRHYRDLMRGRLGLAPERIHAVHIGIAAEGFEPAASPPDPPAIGYLAPLCPAKGLDTLVEAFLALRAGGRVPGLRLRVAGATLAEHRPFVEDLRRRLADAGAAGDVEFLPAPDRAGRQRFLRTVSVLAVPAREAEAFGIFILESLASGVPVVLARRGAYPEILEATGGGVLVEPEDPRSLAEALLGLLARPEEARGMGERGRRAVLGHFNVQRMAGEMVRIFESVAAKQAGPPRCAGGKPPR
jgi:glycosyltransferase involved in cell wall biosynthesis